MTYRVTPAETLLLVLAMIALLIGLTILPARPAQPGQVIRITVTAHADLAIEGSSWPRPVFTTTRWRLVRDPLLPEAAPRIQTDHTLDGQPCRILVWVGQGWAAVDGIWTDVRDLVYVAGEIVRVDQHSRAIGQASYEDYVAEREGD